MKKLSLTLLLLLISISLVLSACGDADTTTTGDQTDQNQTTAADGTEDGTETAVDPDSNMTGPDEFPIVHDKITLSVFVAPAPSIGDFSENYATQIYEEMTNIHIEWQQVGRDDAPNRINLMLASGSDLPDIFMTTISQDQQVVYGEQGLFLPLNDYIDRYGVRTKKMFNYDPTIEGQITAPDGNIYGLPEYNECYHCDFGQRAWINEVWLENLDLQKPQTLDEFYDVLVAFKENDANQNGDPNDEIPLTTVNGVWNGSIEPFLMNSFLYHQGTNTDRIFLDDNFRMHFAPITEEWREGLRFLNKLYAEGLMDPEVFIIDSTQVKQLTENPDGNQVGVVFSGHYAQFADLGVDGAKLDFGPLSPLVGPNGVRNATRYLTTVHMCFFITNACEYPEIAFRWGDGLIADVEDTGIDFERGFLSWGEEGVDWERLSEDSGYTGLDGRPALFRHMLPFGEPHNKHWGQPRPTIGTNTGRFSQMVELGTWEHEYELFLARRDYFEPFGPEIEKVIPPLFMDLETVEQIGEMRVTIRDYIDETVARFVTGDLDLDNDWDMVISNFEAMGVDAFVQALQENYDRQYR